MTSHPQASRMLPCVSRPDFSTGRTTRYTPPARGKSAGRLQAVRRFFLLSLALCLVLFSLAGCGFSKKNDSLFQIDIYSFPTTIDPQLAYDETALLIIENTFEGLLRRNQEGALVEAAARDYTRSADGVTYTFYLQDGLLWSDGETPVTADDFVYAFQRLADPALNAPFASNYGCIRNFEAVRRGELPASQLGVRAEDALTLVFTLEYPNLFFPQLLTAAAAMPCNRQFLRESMGKYGATAETTLYNGPFYLRRLTAGENITLRRNEAYGTEEDRSSIPAGVNLLIQAQQQDPVSRLTEQRVDAAPVNFEQQAQLAEKGYTITSFEDTVWCLVFNTRAELVGDTQLRKALHESIDYNDLKAVLPSNMRTASTLVPPVIRLAERSYREAAGEQLEVYFSPPGAKGRLQEVLNRLELQSLPKVTILCSDDDATLKIMGELQSQWQTYLNTFIHFDPMSQDEVVKKVGSGDYQAALYAVKAQYDSPHSLLSQFCSEGNLTGYTNSQAVSLLDQAVNAETLNQSLDYFTQAEQLILEDAPIIPLSFETTYYATAKGVSGLWFSPYAARMFFRYADK